ncbi:MAG: hypothetical protein ACJ8NR_06075 [Sulfurifustis sp.]
MQRLFLAFLLIVGAAPLDTFAQIRDVMLWLPPANARGAPAKIAQNQSYYSIKLHSVYASYDSGSLNDARRLVVASELAMAEPAHVGIGTIVHKTFRRGDEHGDVVTLDDYLVPFAPATAMELRIKILLRSAAGEDFRPVFEALSDPALKTSLSLSSVNSPLVTAMSYSAENFLAPPYLATEGKQALDIRRTVYFDPDAEDHKDDALREGYLVLISSNGMSAAEAMKMTELTSKELRIAAKGGGLEIREGGSWKPFKRASYAILTVTSVSVRGEDRAAPWFKKYGEALQLAKEKLAAPEPAAGAAASVAALFNEATALLGGDIKYVSSEREFIKALRYQQLDEACKPVGGAAAAGLKPAALGVAADFATAARQYKEKLAGRAPHVAVQALDDKDNPLPGIYFRLINLDTPSYPPLEGRTNYNGEYTFNDLMPGRYFFQVWIQTWTNRDRPDARFFVLEAKEAKKITLKKPKKES